MTRRSPRNRTLAAVAASGTAFLLLRPAHAQGAADRPLPHDMRLEYVRGPGAETCPDESYFRDTVERRVSYAPFKQDAAARVVVTVSREGARYRGRWEVIDAAGIVRQRDIPPAGVAALPDCYNVVQGLGLAFSIELEPLGKPAIPPPSRSPTLPPPTLPPPPPPKPAPVPSRRFFVSLVGLAAFGQTPDPAGGAALGVGRRWGAWSLSGEVHAAISLNNPLIPGVTSTLYRVTGALVPCGHWRWLFGCAVLEAGVLGAGSNAPYPASGTSFVGDAGLRAGLEIPLTGPLSLRLAVDGLIALPRVALVLDGLERWRSPAGSLVAGGGFAAAF